MIDKTIKLTGEYPSDFKPTVPVQEVQQYFDAYSFHDGRMLGGSKVDYHGEHPDDLIIFNANVLMPGYGKVWYGDINLTEDYLVLKPSNELLDKAVWNTSEDSPTHDWYKKKMAIKYENIQIDGC